MKILKNYGDFTMSREKRKRVESVDDISFMTLGVRELCQNFLMSIRFTNSDTISGGFLKTQPNLSEIRVSHTYLVTAV